MGRTRDSQPHNSPSADISPPARPDRRSLVKGLLIGAGGVALGGGAGAFAQRAFGEDGTPASAASVDSWMAPERQVDIIWSVNTAERLVALTFDDGPLPRWTPLALDALEEARVRATFFVVGSRLERHAAGLGARLARHELGNHTWGHDDLSRLGRTAGYRTVHRTHVAITRLTGKEPRLLRPPWGRLGGTTVHVAAQHGYDIALWSLLVQDSRLARDPRALVEGVVDNARPGTVLLAHDVGRPSRLEAIRRLPEMIAGLRRRGFEFVTVSELRQAGVRSPGRTPRPS